MGNARDNATPGACCAACGYSLRGHAGAARVCPECGATNVAPFEQTATTIGRGWLLLAIVPALVALLVMLGFRVALKLENLTVHDLASNGQPLSGIAKPGSMHYASLGAHIATPCFILAALTFTYCIPLLAAAAIRRNGLAAAVALLMGLTASMAGHLAIEVAFNIAGL